MMISRRTVLGASGILVLSAAARTHVRANAATPTAGDDAILVPVDLSEWEIDPDQRVLRTGQPYRFVVHNEGKVEHEWVIELKDANDQPLEREAEAEGDEPAVSELEEIAPGTEKALTWSFGDPGDYKMVCHIPGHAEAGMVIPFSVVADAQVVEVEATDFALALGQQSVKAGSPVAFVVHNLGKVEHEFVLEAPDAMDEPFEENGMVSEIEDIEPGTRRELIWTFAEPGEIKAVCHVEGHFEAGMVTTLMVTA